MRLSLFADSSFFRAAIVTEMAVPPIRFSRKAERTGAPPIAFLMKEAVTNPNLISLAAGLVDYESLPTEETLKLLSAMLSDKQQAQIALQYGTTEGLEQLRKLLLQRLEKLEGKSAEQLGLSLRNVLVAGRCVSSDRYLQGSIRVMPGCYITGQAAGVAAAIAVEQETDTRGFAVSELQGRLKDMGAYLPNC